MKKYYVLFPKTGRTLDEQKDCCERMAYAAEELYGDQANTLTEISMSTDWLNDEKLGNELRSNVIAKCIEDMQEADVIVSASECWDYEYDPYFDSLFQIVRSFPELHKKAKELPCPLKRNKMCSVQTPVCVENS